ncbi:MAG: PSD1 and planctomycete cytochrome C domain-containing protein [Gemmataceae bacterium]
MRAITVEFLLLGVSGVITAAENHAPSPQHVEFFEKHVRPVLAEHCWSCHGPSKQMAGLRLDTRAAVLKGSDNGPVVVVGQPDQSRLVRAVRRQGDIQMPPKGPLPASAVEAVATWTRLGLPWPDAETAATDAPPVDAGRRHWAFQPIRNPPVPAVRDKSWPRTAVDHFILAQLEAQGLSPSPPAEPRTLIRRLYFDLIGLPPTPEDVQAFEQAARRNPQAAIEDVVDRLLASPHYGERWGRYWLDVARYADTKGYVFFEEPNYPWAYTYRDYVVRSFNDDLPYDQFILHQLAADQLPLGADRRPLTALGFLTVGGRFMNNVHDIIDDRIDVVTRGLLGLTVSCARCHDHKYDPIPTRDYYSLYGIFASCREPIVPPLFEPPPRTAEYQKFAEELQLREQKLNDFVRTKHAELVQAAKTRVAEYWLAVHAQRSQPATDDFMLLADGKDLNPKMLERWRVYLEQAARRQDPVFVPWHYFASLAEADFAEQATSWCAELRQQPQGRIHPHVARRFAEQPPTSIQEAAQRYSDLLNEVEQTWQEELRKAAAANVPPPTALADPDKEVLRQVFHAPEAAPNIPLVPGGDLSLLPDRPSQAKLKELLKEVETWRMNGPGAPPRAMVLEDMAKPWEPYVFLRGNPNNRGVRVPRQFLEVLSGDSRRPFQHGSGRLELAQAIVSRDNPLPARVLVNRVWMYHFGKPLVGTPSDFGLRSDPPSHPELLDHLATLFMAPSTESEGCGWSIKKLHRLLVLSAVYQQRGADRAEGIKVDPDNTLLWKMNRQRLDFEALRDALLAVSGRLDRTIGGPPVKDIVAPTARRRTLYGHIDRLNMPNLLRSFDFPSPDATSPQRSHTTVPQQTLFLMNHPFVQECVRALLQRPEVAQAVDTERRIDRLYHLLYGRSPTTADITLGREFLEDDTSKSWERYVHVLLLANEFAFVD